MNYPHFQYQALAAPVHVDAANTDVPPPMLSDGLDALYALQHPAIEGNDFRTVEAPTETEGLPKHLVCWTDLDGTTYLYRIAFNNFSATRDPTGFDDANDNYSPGSLWLNRTAQTVWFCASARVEGAVWVELT
jgi:hypothetical protein